MTKPVNIISDENLEKIFEIFAHDNPDPRIELDYINHYTLLLCVVLSAQATDVSVNKATKPLFEIADTPEKILALGEEKLIEFIKPIGLYRAKAKNIMALSKKLIEEYQGVVPQTMENLLTLPGVGQKTANVVLNCLFDMPTIAVDTHVFRVTNRIGICDEPDVYKTEIAIMKKISSKWLKNAHYWLILHGRYICKARKPLCGSCKVKKYCLYKDKNEY